MIFAASNNLIRWLGQRSRLTLGTASLLKHKTAHIIRCNHAEAKKKDEPVKFTASQANINYRASLNFHGDTRDLPDSHNLVVASSLILSLIYLFYLRDDIENDGGAKLFQPVHETIPELAIPLLRSAIAENRKFGQDTSKLEKKLAEYMKEPEKYGGNELARRKLIEN